MRALLFLALVGCSPSYKRLRNAESAPSVAWSLVRTIPHDSSSFTEGLVFHEGTLFESSGGDGDSRILASDATGTVIAQKRLPDQVAGRTPFAEGLAIAGGTLVQLTWKNERALTWSTALNRNIELPYKGEGWGLCFDGEGFWRSDGSANLRRHAKSFVEERRVEVTLDGVPVRRLNELECVGDRVFANVFQTKYVVVIKDGVVVGVLNLSDIVATEDASGRESVLNGIAWDPVRRELYVTGKNWAHTYVLRLD